MRATRNIILCLLYGAIIIGFGFWWASNFTGFAKFKGDESFIELAFVFAITMVAGIIFKSMNKEVGWAFVIVMPFLICFLSIFISMFLVFLEISGGTTVDDLRFYPIVHFLVAAPAYGVQVKRQEQ